MTSALESLPVEIQWKIFGLLDPIGLIAASQTSKTLREQIRPQRCHFQERLLAVECLLEYHAGCTFSTAKNTPSPWWTSPEWDQARFACGACLKLRRHTSFQHKYIAQLRFKKPYLGSPPTLMRTSWTPSNRGKSWGRAQWQRDKQNDALAPPLWKKRLRWATGVWLAAYNLAYREDRRQTHLESVLTLTELGSHAMPEQGIEAWPEITTSDIGEVMQKEIARIEYQYAGYDRAQRLCNSCYLTKHGSKDAGPPTNLFSELKSRKLPYATAIERWFPGLIGRGASDGSSIFPDGPRHRRRISRLTIGTSATWDLKHKLCQMCHIPKEIRSFAHSSVDVRSLNSPAGGEIVDRTHVTCHQCIAKEEGGREQLSELLRERALNICERDMLKLQSTLCVVYKPPLALSTGEFPLMEEDAPVGPYQIPAYDQIWSLDELEEMVRRYRYCLHLREKDFFTDWLPRFAGIEKPDMDWILELWKWFRDTANMAREHPHVLLDWALSRHGAELDDVA
ncbi:uncharacterized protein F5Z01DRAFT_750475 [Emericellopsis atlantica]|uniref:F-box domain-containing protein n=1 Tax=Emericellopsis atlantica TaxID=2614577 RepID=A0A9P7ZLR7_9HYPO|nr:uncharacterized protein F5Z01DRAFT_750475 [Emericellopsis atlantica]KAG9254016.1 hypothetical protein F5Z01DRAFT_750475 [Emericellopsis atlantica]